MGFLEKAAGFVQSYRCDVVPGASGFIVFSVCLLKGFCLPQEVAEEMEREDGTNFHNIESGGLGEGEGTKDVSDQIENEDQLDDAMKLVAFVASGQCHIHILLLILFSPQ